MIHEIWLFKGIHYKYDFHGQDILSDINLTIKTGAQKAFVGFQDLGKSTLAKMMVNFYNPSQGEIMTGGSEFKSYW